MMEGTVYTHIYSQAECGYCISCHIHMWTAGTVYTLIYTDILVLFTLYSEEKFRGKTLIAHQKS